MDTQNTMAIFQQIKAIYLAGDDGMARRIYDKLKMIDITNNLPGDTIGFLIEDSKKNKNSAVAAIGVVGSILAATNVDANDQERAGQIREYFIGLLCKTPFAARPQEFVFEDLFSKFYSHFSKNIKQIDKDSSQHLKIIFAQLHNYFQGKKEPEAIARYEEFFGLVEQPEIESTYGVANSGVGIYSTANDVSGAGAARPSSPPPPPIVPRSKPAQPQTPTQRKGVLPTPTAESATSQNNGAASPPPPQLPPRTKMSNAEQSLSAQVSTAASDSAAKTKRDNTHEAIEAPFIDRKKKLFVNLSTQNVSQLLEIFKKSEHCANQPDALKKILIILSERGDTKKFITRQETEQDGFQLDLFSSSDNNHLTTFKTDKDGKVEIDFYGFYTTVEDVRNRLVEILEQQQDSTSADDSVYIEILRPEAMSRTPTNDEIYVEVTEGFFDQKSKELEEVRRGAHKARCGIYEEMTGAFSDTAASASPTVAGAGGSAAARRLSDDQKESEYMTIE